MGLSITQTLEFDTGHRLMCHEGKCRNVHGHRYKVELEMSSSLYTAPHATTGMLLDFTDVKRTVGAWVDANWDHGFVGQAGDPLLAELTKLGLKVYTVPVPPTAENMVLVFVGVATALLRPFDVQVESVRWYETPRCWASWKRSER